MAKLAIQRCQIDIEKLTILDSVDAELCLNPGNRRATEQNALLASIEKYKSEIRTAEEKLQCIDVILDDSKG